MVDSCSDSCTRNKGRSGTKHEKGDERSPKYRRIWELGPGWRAGRVRDGARVSPRRHACSTPAMWNRWGRGPVFPRLPWSVSATRGERLQHVGQNSERKCGWMVRERGEWARCGRGNHRKIRGENPLFVFLDGGKKTTTLDHLDSVAGPPQSCDISQSQDCDHRKTLRCTLQWNRPILANFQ